MANNVGPGFVDGLEPRAYDALEVAGEVVGSRDLASFIVVVMTGSRRCVGCHEITLGHSLSTPPGCL